MLFSSGLHRKGHGSPGLDVRPLKGVTPLKPAEEPRVSIRRQGETTTKIKAVLEVGFAENWIWAQDFAAFSRSA